MRKSIIFALHLTNFISSLGADLTTMKQDAIAEHMSQPVVGYFSPKILLSEQTSNFFFDFHTCTVAELQTFEIPLNFKIDKTGICHGIACWFDCDFIGSGGKTVLFTGPEKPGTHWYQCRLLFVEPLAVNKGQTISGLLKFQANDKFSYDVDVYCKIDGTSDLIDTKNLIFMQVRVSEPKPSELDEDLSEASTCAFRTVPEQPAAESNLVLNNWLQT